MYKLFQKILFLVLIFASQILPQSFGFGCLGFVGGFGAFTYQQYNANGLNRYVANFNTTYSEYLDNEMGEFTKATGYRLGVNVFRAKFSGLFFTAKGFYQQLLEDHSARVYQTAIGIDYEYDLKIKSWGIGADIGIPVTDFLSWKILDGSILVNSARFTETINSSQGTAVKKYVNDETEIGYSLGTGFIIEIIKNYISIEGSASYTQLTIDKMVNEDGSGNLNFNSRSSSEENFISGGGFNAVVQLNLGFPL